MNDIKIQGEKQLSKKIQKALTELRESCKEEGRDFEEEATNFFERLIQNTGTDDCPVVVKPASESNG